jgi:hypothetical protein
MLLKHLAVASLFVLFWSATATAQSWVISPPLTATYYNLSSFNAALAQRVIIGTNFNVRTVIVTCAIRLSLGGCSVNSPYVQLINCKYNGTAFSASFPANASTFTLPPSDTCDLRQSPTLEIGYCNTVGCTTVSSTDRTSNAGSSWGQATISLNSPYVNPIVTQATRIIGSSTDSFSVTGFGLPQGCCDGNATVGTRSWETGLPCAAISSVTVNGQTTALSNVVAYFASSAMDGCFLMLLTIDRRGVPAFGAGTTYPTNIARSYIAASPSVSTGSPNLLFRSSSMLTLIGTSLPKRNEAYQILLSASGGNCTGSTECTITNYNALNNVTCRADLSVFSGDDSVNGGCLITAKVTRLGYAGVVTSTTMRCPNILPPVAPVIGSGQPFNFTATTTQRGLSVADINSALSGAAFAVSIPGGFNLTATPCTVYLNVSECGLSTLPVALDSCIYNNSVLSGVVSPNAVSAFSNGLVCRITEMGLRARFCNESNCATTILRNFTNTAFSGKYLINSAPVVNALTKGSTRIGGSSTLLAISGSALPLLGDLASIEFTLSPIDGGVCDTPIANASILTSTGTTATVEYTVSPYNDGCRIQLSGISRAFVRGTGAGVTSQNVVRDYIAGNPIVSFGSSDEGNRTSFVTFTLAGTNFPLGPSEDGYVTLSTSGGSCFTLPSIGLRCNITSYQADSLNCTTDLTNLVGDDEANGGCPIFATVTRLGTTGPLDSTGLSFRYCALFKSPKFTS